MSGTGLDLARVREAIAAGRIVWSEHAALRMQEHGFVREEVLYALAGGEVIESYPDDTPYPSGLVLWFVGGRPVHVVVALNDHGPEAHVITVYEPGPHKFEPDWRTRRKP